jgi:hypothetical protein
MGTAFEIKTSVQGIFDINSGIRAVPLVIPFQK